MGHTHVCVMSSPKATHAHRVFHHHSASSFTPFFRRPLRHPVSKALTMNRNPYTRLSQIYIRLIRGYSPHASQALEEILNTYGPRATYCAALGLASLARRAKETGGIDSIELDTHHLSDMPEVLPLYHEAVKGLSSDVQVRV